MLDILYQLHHVETLYETGSYVYTNSYPTLLFATQRLTITTKRPCLLGKNRLLYIKPYTTFSFSLPKNTQLTIISFQHYELQQQENTALHYYVTEQQLPPNLWQSEQLPMQFRMLIQQLITLPKDFYYQKGKYLLAPLFDDYITLAWQKQDKINNPHLLQALYYIQAHYHTALTRNHVADMIGFNPTYFSTLFQQKFGWSFSTYVNRLRLEKAKVLLWSTSKCLQEIATIVGYSSGLYLNRKFKEFFQLTPGQFRQQKRPERVAAFQFLGHLSALNITPVATETLVYEHSALLHEQLKNIPIVDLAHSIEPLKQQRPDVILIPMYYFSMPERIQALEKIAPILAVDWQDCDVLSDMTRTGKLFDKSVEAQHWQQHYLTQVQLAKKQLAPIAHDTFALYELRHNGIYIWSSFMRGAYNIYHALGLRAPTNITKEVLQPNEPLFIAEEELPQYLAQHMFIIICKNDHDTFEKRLARNDWQALEKVQLYFLSHEEFWNNDGKNTELQLYKQVHMLTKRYNKTQTK